MALPTPLKHPSSPVPPIAHSPDPSFVPRKEFLQDHRVISSFALLALSGTSLVRSYSFPVAVNDSLRQLFERNGLQTWRTNESKEFYEFALEGRPWANPKAVKSEKLIIDILEVILHYGHNLLSPIDYGREPDDRVAIAFSKPNLSQPSNVANASAASLNNQMRVLFAISFASASVMRVVSPPLSSTPAILQAVRNAWPRGTDDDSKKVGHDTFEFKLKGYKWYQENTFATDSLRHILYLLSALDRHGFELLVSISLGKRSRVKDLWIFTGVARSHYADSSTVTPNGSSLELRREGTPQNPLALSHGSKLGFALSKAQTVPIGNGVANGHTLHTRSASDTTPVRSSPLKSSPFTRATGRLLRKASPKKDGPPAIPEQPESTTTSPTQSPRVGSNSIGSCDMTGVGSGMRRSFDLSRTPDVFYTTDGRPYRDVVHNEYNPFDTRNDSPYHTHPNAAKRASSRSLPPFDLGHQQGSSRPSLQSSHHSSSNTPPLREHSRTNGDVSQDVGAQHPTTPPPALLGPGVFRDSGLSYMTERQSFEIPIVWNGEHPEPTDPRAKAQSGHESPPQKGVNTSVTAGARASPPRDADKNDVRRTLPPTIKEQPSQEDELKQGLKMSLRTGEQALDGQQGSVTAMSPTRVSPQADGVRQSEVASVVLGQSAKSSPAGTPREEHGMKPTHPRKDKDTTSSGWVLVNIEGAGKARGKSDGKKSREGSRSPDQPDNGRVSGDKLVPPRANQSKSPSPGAPVASTMSSAAKTIAIIDAVTAKEEHEKSKSNSGFKRLLRKAKGLNDGGESATSTRSTTPRRKTPDNGAPMLRNIEAEERGDRHRRGSPPTAASKAADQRMDID
ncbi:hypothetical protein K474DRAFT_596866 [Panus rudis PR-1116 ss-1]|nr:hypothetical protein K474DRAFT_596866 [Panus rudis PR-1116 ss-1]